MVGGEGGVWGRSPPIGGGGLGEGAVPPPPARSDFIFLIIVLQEVPCSKKFNTPGSSIVTLSQRCALVMLDASDVLAASCSQSALRAGDVGRS